MSEPREARALSPAIPVPDAQAWKSSTKFQGKIASICLIVYLAVVSSEGSSSPARAVDGSGVQTSGKIWSR